MFKNSLCITLGLLCAASLPAQSKPDATPPAATPEKNAPPLDPKNMDTSVKPGEDFYRYANGNWMKNNPIPPEYSRWSSFNELIEKNNDALHEIAARSGPLYVVTHPGVEIPAGAAAVIVVPKNESELDPILLTIPLQILAYYAAVALGHDVDKPRNLAKPVTVE